MCGCKQRREALRGLLPPLTWTLLAIAGGVLSACSVSLFEASRAAPTVVVPLEAVKHFDPNKGS